MHCPWHDIHAVERTADNLLFHLKFGHFPVNVAVDKPVQFHKHVEHSNDKGAASAGRVNHSEAVKSLFKAIPEVSKMLLSSLFVIVKKQPVYPFLWQVGQMAGKVLNQRPSAHEINLNSWSVENAQI